MLFLSVRVRKVRDDSVVGSGLSAVLDKVQYQSVSGTFRFGTPAPRCGTDSEPVNSRAQCGVRIRLYILRAGTGAGRDGDKRNLRGSV
jgi:hypothetical protein